MALLVAAVAAFPAAIVSSHLVAPEYGPRSSVLPGGYRPAPLPPGVNLANGSYVPTHWVQIANSGPDPALRTQAAFAFDYADGCLVMFSGMNNYAKTPADNFFNETWIFQNGNWTHLKLTVQPPARRAGELVYDFRDGYTVLFGGSNNTQYLNDTWEFKAYHWIQLHPATAPPPRRSEGLAFDGGDHFVVMFGGHGGSVPYAKKYVFYNDTWAFGGGQWTRLATALAPPAIAEPYFAYDPLDNLTVLFGGYDNQNVSVTEYTMNFTWVFSAGRWTNLSSGLPVHPTWRDGGYLEYDPLVGGLFMFGGDDLKAALLDTWTFDHGAWHLYDPAGAPVTRGSNKGAWDPVLDGVVTWGVPCNATTGGPLPHSVGQTWVQLAGS